jgi:hypothetical protein
LLPVTWITGVAGHLQDFTWLLITMSELQLYAIHFSDAATSLPNRSQFKFKFLAMSRFEPCTFGTGRKCATNSAMPSSNTVNLFIILKRDYNRTSFE